MIITQVKTFVGKVVLSGTATKEIKVNSYISILRDKKPEAVTQVTSIIEGHDINGVSIITAHPGKKVSLVTGMSHSLTSKFKVGDEVKVVIS
jgi:predicted membrane GTPase involved in stress response